jgi:hypothetical protein
MPFVLDASIPACWAFQDEQDPRANAAYVRIKAEEAVAPGLWWFEMRSILVVNERRKTITASNAPTRANSIFAAVPPSRPTSPETLPRSQASFGNEPGPCMRAAVAPPANLETEAPAKSQANHRDRHLTDSSRMLP